MFGVARLIVLLAALGAMGCGTAGADRSTEGGSSAAVDAGGGSRALDAGYGADGVGVGDGGAAGDLGVVGDGGVVADGGAVGDGWGGLDVSPGSDSGERRSDAGGGPAGAPFGEIVGPCAGLAELIAADSAGVVINTFAFDGDPFDAGELGEDAATLFAEPNAGGSSKCSEVFSMELMDACVHADLYKTETEIEYTASGAITDYAMMVGGTRLGVSVTRAYKGPQGVTFSPGDAADLLEKKLAGINESTAHVAPADAWSQQVLHVWTLRADWAETVAQAWVLMSDELKADTLVVVTVETGSDFVVTDGCD